MKENPKQKALEGNFLPGKLSAEGFLGEDRRTLAQIIQDDLSTLARLGSTPEKLADHMQKLTDIGKAQLGRAVVTGHLEVTVSDVMGSIPCPFADAYRADKRQTEVKNLTSGKSCRWSDLNIHMLARHGFCEGRGSYFRIEPTEILTVIGEQI